MNLKLAHLENLIGMRFNIPYYQRGYRWETKQVLDLLDDLFEFQQSNPEPGSFYCLQPLVVCKNSVLSNENFVVFDVIDGQQRLTTLFLMMNHLSLNAFGLRYERAVIREESPNLWENGRLDYKVLQSFSDKEMADNPDYFYMKQAMACIDGWIAEKKNEFPRIEDLMKDVLQDRNYKNSDLPFYELTEDKNSKQSDVRFIWYEDEATGGSSIDTFKRLNYGKTPLTATELIKALLLQCDVYKNRKAEMKQIAFRMSTEWDAMEKALQDDFMWSMLFPLKYEKASRIDIVLSFVSIELQEKHGIEVKASGDDKDYDYLVFNKYIEREVQNNRQYDEVVKELWANIQDTFAIFGSWFEDRELYHLTGLYLTLLNQNAQKDMQTLYKKHMQTLRELVEKFKSSNRQSYIENVLKKNIGNLIRIKESRSDDSEEHSFENLYYGKFSSEMGKILLVYNVDVTMRHGQDRAYFPFRFYQTTTPSLEHIHPQNLHDEDIDFVTRCRWFKDKCAELRDEDMKDEKLRAAVDGLNGILNLSAEEESEKKSDDAKKSLKEKSERYAANEYEYGQLLKVIDDHFNELADIDEKELHNISNMALVDSITNTRLGNGLLNTKRSVLLKVSEEYDSTNGNQGACVYMGTWKVFNKEYAPDATNLRFWTKIDRENYLNALKTTYDEYTK